MCQAGLRSPLALPDVLQGEPTLSLRRPDLPSLLPHRMQKAINRLSRLLKPGGMMLLRDYGRHDMAQLRFKKGIVGVPGGFSQLSVQLRLKS